MYTTLIAISDLSHVVASVPHHRSHRQPGLLTASPQAVSAIGVGGDLQHRRRHLLLIVLAVVDVCANIASFQRKLRPPKSQFKSAHAKKAYLVQLDLYLQADRSLKPSCLKTRLRPINSLQLIFLASPGRHPKDCNIKLSSPIQTLSIVGL